MQNISFLDWLYGLIFGKIPLSDNYIPKAGDRIASTIKIENTGALPINDSEILAKLESISDAEFEDKIYKDTGIKVTTVNREGRIISSGREWQYKYTYDIEGTPGTPPIAVVAASIVAVCVAIIGVLWAINAYIAENAKIVTPYGEINLFPIIILIVAILLILLIASR